MKIQAPSPELNRVPEEPSKPPGTPPQHKATGVDKLHAEGVTGKGIKIGMERTNEMQPDDDPTDECNGHGSHVAGIIAASGDNKWNVTGVAPDASLFAYRVFGCYGYVTDITIIEALLRAVKDGVDIINLSLGGRDGWTRSSASVVSSRIAANGTVVVIAAGNYGFSGAFYSTAPANAIDAISVGSVENTIIPLQTLNVIGVDHDPIIYFSWLPFNVTEDISIYPLTTNTTIEDDACEELPDSTPDLSDVLVIVRRGTCPFLVKVENLVKKGAKQALFYDNYTNFLGIYVGNFTGALIQAEDGEFLVNQYAAGVDVKLNFPQEGGVIEYPALGGGLMSNFSNYGPTNDFYFKPAISAPGANILSTVPIELGEFAIVSGTSMATPFIAGSAALALSVKGANPDNNRGIRTVLESTAQFVKGNDSESALFQTAIMQGAGLVDVYRAVHATTLVSPGELLLNDTTHFNPVHKFFVNNTAETDKEYILSHTPAGTAITIRPGTIFQSNGPVPLSPAAASVQISPEAFTLGPNESQEVTVTFTQPQDVDPKTFPVYSGFIIVDDSDHAVHVSYMGAAASIKDIQVVDNTDYFFGEKLPLVTNSSGIPTNDSTNYTFIGEDRATFYWRQTFGTPLFRLDVVAANISLRTTLNRRQEDTISSDGHVFTFPIEDDAATFGSVQILGNLITLDYLPRNNEDIFDYGYNALTWVLPKYNNGTWMAKGNYRVLLRALKVTGNPSVDEDYESWLSPIIGVYPPDPWPPADEDPEDPEDPETPEEPEEPSGPDALNARNSASNHASI
ncbi:peptidase [Coprinopsis marcescibilis]|uniref:Peptidase n=1 Tax=Coprinopsis marcescibilis TaxID=230819 RepID=A0A5C3KFF0_COPMA|nr:peptidase [Coprinopsis marcescibilis]